jgi:DnaJ-class molecular chaperone
VKRAKRRDIRDRAPTFVLGDWYVYADLDEPDTCEVCAGAGVDPWNDTPCEFCDGEGYVQRN